MKLVLLLQLIIVFKIYAQTSPITAEILRQTYLISTDTLQGTAFLIEDQNQEYLITAKHLFRVNLKNGDSTKISIFQESKNKTIKAKYFVHEDSIIDIAVLKLDTSIKVLPPYSLGGQIILGQDVYFLGYPAFNDIQFLTTGTRGILPFVKKGIISGWIINGDMKVIFLEGHNNPGFSGGPAIGYDYSSRTSKIFGVISGYYFENKIVKNKKKENEPFYIEENAGIIKCFPIESAQEIILNIR